MTGKPETLPVSAKPAHDAHWSLCGSIDRNEGSGGRSRLYRQTCQLARESTLLQMMPCSTPLRALQGHTSTSKAPPAFRTGSTRMHSRRLAPVVLGRGVRGEAKGRAVHAVVATASPVRPTDAAVQAAERSTMETIAGESLRLPSWWVDARGVPTRFSYTPCRAQQRKADPKNTRSMDKTVETTRTTLHPPLPPD